MIGGIIVEQLLSNMHILCEEMHMLSGLSVSYGTPVQSESVLLGSAQEVERVNDSYTPCLRPLSQDSLFDLASLTKLMTAVLTLRLVERGILDLSEYIGLIDRRFIHLKNATVFDILSYRVSLKTPGRIDEADDREEGLRRLFAVEICECPAIRVYSDINAMVIKYVLEAKCGMPFGEALAHYLFHPIGMIDTHAIVPSEKLHRCVCYNFEHRIAKDAYCVRSNISPGSPHDPKAQALSLGGRDLCGHAGVFSTQSDMIRFAQSLLRGEVIRKESLLTIGTNYTGKPNGDGTWRQYLGFLCFSKHPYQHLSEIPEWMQERSIGLSGFTGNHISIDPIKERFVLFLGNRCHNRVSNIIPSAGKTFVDYGIREDGVGQILWPDGRHVYSSAKYVYFKDSLLHAPIKARMQSLGWL